MKKSSKRYVRFQKLILIKSIIIVVMIVDNNGRNYVKCQPSSNEQQTTNQNKLAFLSITKKSFNNKESELFLSNQTGVYASFSNTNQIIYGQLILPNKSLNDDCYSKYLNKNLPNNYGYVSLVVKNSCTYKDLIVNAIKNNASALFIQTNFETDSDNLNNDIQFENNKFVVILLTRSVGQYLETTLKSALQQNSQSFIYVRISLKQIENNNESNNNVNTVPNMNRSTDLSATSITFIVLGTIGFVLLISAMWVIFYIIQRSRSIEERQRLEQLIQRLTKRAISKMKHRKIKPGDKELFSNEKCAICLEGFEINESIRQLPCFHYFHKKEIDTWLHINQTCPVCKINVLKAYGLNINTKSNCFQRAFERFNFVNSPIALNDGVIAQMSDERRETYYSIRSNNSINYGRTIVNPSDLSTIDRFYSDFQAINMKSEDINGFDEIITNSNNTNTNMNKTNLSNKNKIARKFAFFGELSDNINDDTDHVVLENEDNMSDDNLENSPNKHKATLSSIKGKHQTSNKETGQEEKNSSSRWQGGSISISIPKALNSYHKSNNSNDDSKISIIEDDYNNLDNNIGFAERNFNLNINDIESNNSEKLTIDNTNHNPNSPNINLNIANKNTPNK